MTATWKAAERAIARFVGGRRNPVDGRGGSPDVESAWLAVEVKHRQRLPQWLEAALAQAERSAREGQLAVLVLHEHGRRYAESLVLLRLGAFVDWFGPLVPAQSRDDAAAGDG